MTTILIFLFVNLLAFGAMGLDKQRAKKGDYRIPERALFGFALAFGGVGGTIGMFYFHHKTKHWYFRYGFPVLAIIQIIILLLILL